MKTASTFAAAVALLGAAALCAGCTSLPTNADARTSVPSTSAVPSATATPRDAPLPSPTSPSTADPTAAPAASGFNLTDAYRACVAAKPPGSSGNLTPTREPQADSWGLASADPYTVDHTNNDPDAIYVNVVSNLGGTYVSDLCVVSGDKAAPTVEWIRSLD